MDYTFTDIARQGCVICTAYRFTLCLGEIHICNQLEFGSFLAISLNYLVGSFNKVQK